jgi:hypothetical protein
MLFKKITLVYSEHHAKPIHTLLTSMQRIIVKSGDSGIYHWAFKGLHKLHFGVLFPDLVLDVNEDIFIKL